MKKLVTLLLCICMTSAIGCGSAAKTENKNSVKENKVENNQSIDNKVEDNVNSEEEEYISLETLKAIPEFKCKDVDGNELTNDIFKNNKITVVNVWDTL